MNNIDDNVMEVFEYRCDIDVDERQESLAPNSENYCLAAEPELHRQYTIVDVVETGFKGNDIQADVCNNDTEVYTKVDIECEGEYEVIALNDVDLKDPTSKGGGLFSGDYITKKAADRQQGQPNQQHGQTPYYQQNVSGQPVNSTGPPPVQNAARTPRWQPGNQQNTSSDVPVNADQVRIFESSFDSRIVRHRFIQRVYTILSFQLALSLGIMLLCVYEPHMKQFLKYNKTMLYVCAGVFMVLEIAITCFQPLRRQVPLNFIMLTLLTIAMGFLVGTISTLYRTDIVWMAVGITTVVTLLVSIFACQTRFDITSCAGYLCIASLVVLVIGIVGMIVMMTTGIKIIYLVYSGLIVILFTFYLMFDTQMVMGGRKLQLSEEEYIAGALSLYVDIMYILIFIMQLLGDS